MSRMPLSLRHVHSAGASGGRSTERPCVRRWACRDVTNIRNRPIHLKRITATERQRFIRLLTETGDCGGRLPLVPHS